MSADIRRLVVVPVTTVQAGDELDCEGRPVVAGSVVGANYQRYVIAHTKDGAPVVFEFDRTETVGVWR